MSYVDPADGTSLLDPSLRVARRIDETALENSLLLYSTQPTRDGFAGDQTLLAPAFTSTQGDLDQIVERLAKTVAQVERQVKDELVHAAR